MCILSNLIADLDFYDSTVIVVMEPDFSYFTVSVDRQFFGNLDIATSLV